MSYNYSPVEKFTQQEGFILNADAEDSYGAFCGGIYQILNKMALNVRHIPTKRTTHHYRIAVQLFFYQQIRRNELIKRTPARTSNLTSLDCQVA